MPDGEAGGSDPGKSGDESPASTGSTPAQPDFMPPPPPRRVAKTIRESLNEMVKKKDAVRLKTLLDPEACQKIAREVVGKQEVKIQELTVRSTPGELSQARPSIENFKSATPCEAKWENMSGTDAFRICHKCKLHVYDFTNLDQTAAEELVLQREGKKSSSFYRRKDGKFLTSNCPIGFQQRFLKISAAAAIIIVAGVAIIAGLSVPQAEEPVPSADTSSPDIAASPQQGKRTGPVSEAVGAIESPAPATKPATGPTAMPYSQATGQTSMTDPIFAASTSTVTPASKDPKSTGAIPYTPASSSAGMSDPIFAEAMKSTASTSVPAGSPVAIPYNPSTSSSSMADPIFERAMKSAAP